MASRSFNGILAIHTHVPIPPTGAQPSISFSLFLPLPPPVPIRLSLSPAVPFPQPPQHFLRFTFPSLSSSPIVGSHLCHRPVFTFSFPNPLAPIVPHFLPALASHTHPQSSSPFNHWVPLLLTRSFCSHPNSPHSH
jgi:hypothetical protein